MKVPDLSIFFTIVQRSLLNEENGQFIEYISDRNPRKGISYIQNFLSSAHIQANRAIQNYIQGEANFIFPYHEVFKGCMLSQWKYYKEKHSDAINIFDSGISSKKLQLIRLYILNLLYLNSKSENTAEVEINIIVKTISLFGISQEQIMKILNILLKNQLIVSNNELIDNPSYSLTLTGGYYLNILCRKLVYIESILFDTNIFDVEYFKVLSNQTHAIEQEYSGADRMLLRKERVETFMKYLKSVEDIMHENKSMLNNLRIIEAINDTVMYECDNAIKKTQRNHNNNRYS